MSRFRTLALPAAVLATLALTGCAQKSDHPSHPVRCTEDMACWSWSTMGNHSRGLRSESWDGKHVVTLAVDPCQWRVATKAHTIDPYLNAPMRGDQWAAVHGCEG